MANFHKATGKTIQQAFEQFDRANPKVYELFTQQVFRAVAAGKKKISSKQILGYIRWELFLQTREPTLFEQDGEQIQFKINDAYTAHYARKFVTMYPSHVNLFEFRRIRSNEH